MSTFNTVPRATAFPNMASDGYRCPGLFFLTMFIDFDGNFVAGTSGAFLGAVAAYALGSLSERKKQLDAQHADLLKAQLLLSARIAILRTFKERWAELEESVLRQNQTKTLEKDIQGIIAPPVPSGDVDPTTLGWLLSLKNPNFQLLMELTIANRRFANFIGSIEDRNGVFQKLDTHSSDLKVLPALGGVVGRVNQAHAAELVVLTKDMFQHLDSARIKNEEVLACSPKIEPSVMRVPGASRV